MDAPESALLVYPPSREAGVMWASPWAWAVLMAELPSVLGPEWELSLGRASPLGLNPALGLASSSGLVLPPQSEPSLHPPGTTTGTPAGVSIGH